MTESKNGKLTLIHKGEIIMNKKETEKLIKQIPKLPKLKQPLTELNIDKLEGNKVENKPVEILILEVLHYIKQELTEIKEHVKKEDKVTANDLFKEIQKGLTKKGRTI